MDRLGIFLSICLFFSFQDRTSALTTTTSPDELYGDNICTRQVLEPSYNTSYVTFSCWKPKQIDCNYCYGPRCHKVPLYPTADPGWPWSLSTSWPEGSWNPYTTTGTRWSESSNSWWDSSSTPYWDSSSWWDSGSTSWWDSSPWWVESPTPSWMSGSWWEGTTTDWMSGSWWETTTTNWMSDSWWETTTTTDWMSYPLWETTTTNWMSGSWWEGTTTSVPSWMSSLWSTFTTTSFGPSSWWQFTDAPSWISSGWWSSSYVSPWSQNWWSSEMWPESSSSWSQGSWSSGIWSVSPWTSGWNSGVTMDPNAEYMCFSREMGQCFTTQHIRSHCYKEVEYCCEGYQQFGQICTETEHCMGDNGGCEQTCTDGYNGPQCSCWPGFISDGDKGCTDVNECDMYRGICDHKCVNTLGSYYCECNPGYIQSPSGKCEPINKCHYGNGGCEHHCVNTTAGEHRCSCASGFMLTDGYRCEDPRFEKLLRGREAREKDHGFSTAAIVGIAVGCICAVALIILVVMVGVKLFANGRHSTGPPVVTTESGATQFSNPEYMKKCTATGNVYEVTGPPPNYDSLKNGHVYDNPVGPNRPSIHIPRDKPVHTES